MNINKPFNINLKGGNFDFNESRRITWQVSGAIQTSFAINIYRNDTDNLVWSLPQTNSYNQNYTLAAGSIANGYEYKIQIQVWAENGSTASSYAEVFRASTKPTVNITTTGIINNASALFEAEYSQIEGVSMRSYQAFLYNSAEVLINSSPILTGLPLQHLFTGLQSDSTYYIEFQATSNYGLIGASGKIQFNVLYGQPTINILPVAENIPELAAVRLSWNVLQIIAKPICEDEEMIFLDDPNDINNKMLDLRDSCGIYFDEGFRLDKNGTVSLWLEKPTHKQNLLILRGQTGEFRLQYNDIYECFFLYKIKFLSGLRTFWASNKVERNKRYYVEFRQINNDVDFKALALD
ncbi:hypothetical protein [Halalkalibacter oceani]|uniref:hypothetical protein n=1 Tax=Halalkalibacter oceani TaxID=1653776 RepID=UPI0033990AE9